MSTTPKDYGPIAARVKDAATDLLWMGALGLEGSAFLDASRKIAYVPPRHFCLSPAPGPMAANPAAEGTTSLTLFEEQAPYLSNKDAPAFVVEFAAWQILEAAAIDTKGLDDKVMGAWLKANKVDTMMGQQTFTGPNNSGPVGTALKQIQKFGWTAVWPASLRLPGIVLHTPVTRIIP